MRARRDRVRVFRDAGGDWRWRRVAPNGRIIAVAGEGYRNRAHAETMARRVNRRCQIEVQP